MDCKQTIFVINTNYDDRHSAINIIASSMSSFCFFKQANDEDNEGHDLQVQITVTLTTTVETVMLFAYITLHRVA